MTYSIDEASKLSGKRVIVSIRTISTDKEDQFSGFWGVIDSAHEEGILVRIEGGTNEEFEMIPPDISFLQPSQNKFYQFNDDQIIEHVDYEVYWSESEEIENL